MRRIYTCFYVHEPVTIDGRLDKPFWANVPWTKQFVDILGESAPKPHLSTRAKVAWNNEFLFIGAQLDEPHVWANLTQRDSVIFQDNDFEVFIDPDGDNHQYYEIEINALNTVWDLLLIKPYRDGGPAVNCWDIAGMKSAVHVNGTLNDPTDIDQGWSLEMALPWGALKECAHRTTPPLDGDRWRINFSRVQWQTKIVNGTYIKTPNRPEDNWVWSPQGVVDMHRPETWGDLVFSTRAAHPSLAAHSVDPADEVRDLLMQIYHAQRKYYSEHAAYADGLDTLRIKKPAIPGLKLTIQWMETAFVATATAPIAGKTRTWHVREDSRIWTSDGG